MIHLRPTRSDSAPMNTNNGIASNNAIATMYCAERPFTFNTVWR